MLKEVKGQRSRRYSVNRDTLPLRKNRRRRHPGDYSRDGRCMIIAPPGRYRTWIICADCGRESLKHNTALYREGRHTCCGCTYQTVAKRIDDVRALVRRGYSYDRISRELGFGKNAIVAAMRKHGIKAARRTSKWPSGITPAMRLDAVRLADETSARYAAEYFGVTERSIVRWRNGHIKKVGGPQPEMARGGA